MKSNLAPVRLAVSVGRFPGDPLKNLTKISFIGKSGLQSNIKNRKTGSAQEPLGGFNPVIQEVFKRRFVDKALKTAQAFPSAHGCGPGNILQ